MLLFRPPIAPSRRDLGKINEIKKLHFRRDISINRQSSGNFKINKKANHEFSGKQQASLQLGSSKCEALHN